MQTVLSRPLSDSVLHDTIPEDTLRHFEQNSFAKRVILKDTERGGFKILRLFDTTNPSEYDSYKQSVLIREMISSPLIIPMYDNYVDSNNHLACISSVYYPFGNLFQFSENELLDPLCYLYIAKQLIKGVMQLHDQRICHGDIRLCNIYVRDIKRNTRNIIDISVVIGSLYHSFIINNISSNLIENPFYQSNYCEYYAPETFQNQYSFASDMYSIGICLYYLIEHKYPFNITISNESIMNPDHYSVKNIFNSTIWKELPPSFIDLISSLLYFEPSKRINAEDAYNYTCFNSITSNRLNTKPISPYTILGTTNKSKDWKVFMVRCHKTGDFLAIKKQENLTELRINEFEKIYDIMMKNPNRNVLTPIEYWIEEEDSDLDKKLITRTLCSSTKCYAKSDLVRFMKNNRILFLPERVIKQIAKQLLLATEYLHKQHLVHRNIKLEHIIVKSFKGLFDDIADINILLSGFGDMIFWKESDPYMKENVCNSLYTPPEMRNFQYTNKVDSWNIGVILYALVTRKFPFITEYSDSITYDYSIPLSYTFGEHNMISNDFLQLISSLLTIDYTKRPTPTEALAFSCFDE